MIDSFNDPILDMAVENQLRWNYNTLFRDCRIEPMIDDFRVDGLNIEFDYVYLNAEKSNLLDLGREVEIEFHCTKYESMEINKLSEALLDRYKDLANSLNFDSGIKSLEGESSGYLGDRLGSGKVYDIASGKLVDANATGVLTKNDNTPLSESELAQL